MKPKRADLRPERFGLKPERFCLRPEKADFRLERADIKKRTKNSKWKMENRKLPCVEAYFIGPSTAHEQASNLNLDLLAPMDKPFEHGAKSYTSQGGLKFICLSICLSPPNQVSQAYNLPSQT